MGNQVMFSYNFVEFEGQICEEMDQWKLKTIAYVAMLIQGEERNINVLDVVFIRFSII